MRFADIACGSGSFLLGIYDTILRYHATYYNRNKKNRAEGRKAGCIETEGGGLRLSLLQKRTILLTNIYGVDIDQQAVEVAQLSLYLKMLEEETIASTHKQLEMRQALLPSLSQNIKSGNALIDWDILDGALFEIVDPQKLNPMNFDDAFPEIMKEGGFHAIVGNPPWGATFTEPALAYLRNKYARVITRTIDSYIYFLDRGTQLLTDDGVLGFIIPSTVLNQVETKPVRRMLLDRGLTHLVSLGAGIFGPKVKNTSSILITQKIEDAPFALHDLSKVPLAQKANSLTPEPTTRWKVWRDLVEQDSHLTFFVNDPVATALLTYLRAKHGPLSEVVLDRIQRGVSPDVADAHVASQEIVDQRHLELDLLRKSVSGVQIKRYQDWAADQYIILTTRGTAINRYPNIYAYLKTFKHLNSCPEVREEKHPWWALHRPRSPEIFTSPKVIGLTTTKTIELIFDHDQSVYVTDAMYVFQVVPGIDPWVVIGIMQSKLFLFLYRVANQGESRIIPQVKASKLGSLPFPTVNDSQASALRHLIDQIREAKQQALAAQTERNRIFYEGRFSSLDRQINTLVYEIYNLSENEKTLVENSSLV